MKQINETGTKQLIEWLRANGTQAVVEQIHRGGLSAWQDDAERTADEGYSLVELGRFQSRTGNPVTLALGPECFEEVE